MKFSRTAVAAGTALLLGTAVSGVPGAAAAGTAPSDWTEVALPIAHFSHLVVDGAHGHVFISGGAGTDGIVVTDLDGRIVTTIDDEPGATGLALSPDNATLYAALPGSDAIAAIDTNALTESARYATGPDTHPDSLAFAGGSLWFGYGGAGAAGIGSVDPAGTVALGQDPAGWAGAPILGTTPTASGELAAAVQDGAAADVVTYDVSGGTLTRRAARALPVPDLADLAITADGQDLVVPSWQDSTNYGLRVSDLTQDERLPEDLGAPAVAIAPDGAMAGCGCNAFEFETFGPDGSGFYREYPVIGWPQSSLAPDGLAWAPDESRVYGVSTPGGPDATPTLVIGTSPETADVRFRTAQSDSVAPGEPFSLHVAFDSTLVLPDVAGRAMPGTVRITRYDEADPDGVPATDAVAWPPNPLNGFFGGYVVSGTAPLTGSLGYHIDYSGGGHYAAAATTVGVSVARYAPGLTLSAPASDARAVPLTVTGKLSWPHDHVRTGTVDVVRTDLAHPSGYHLGTVPVAADGGIALHDTPSVGGANTYRFTYGGGSSYLPVTASATVQVSRATPSLSVTSGAASYPSGARAKVTAHLGTAYNSRVVTLSAQPAGGARTVLKTGKADSTGHLVAYATVTRNTTFTASFAGDDRYAPRTVTRSVTLTPKTQSTLQYPDGTTRIGSTTYHVFRSGTLGFALKVTPNQSTGCATATVEHYYGHAWHHVTTSGCLPSGGGWYEYARALKSFTAGDRYRISGHYARPATGARTGSVSTPWTYVTHRP